MKIYLAGAIAGGRNFEEGMKSIYDTVTGAGHEVLTPFVVFQEINQARFPGMEGAERSRAIRMEDMNLLKECHIAIAEVSQPSIGVGIELGHLEAMGVPILSLRHESLGGSRMSALVEGSDDQTFKYYNSATVSEIISRFLLENESREGQIRRGRE